MAGYQPLLCRSNYNMMAPVDGLAWSHPLPQSDKGCQEPTEVKAPLNEPSIVKSAGTVLMYLPGLVFCTSDGQRFMKMTPGFPLEAALTPLPWQD